MVDTGSFFWYTDSLIVWVQPVTSTDNHSVSKQRDRTAHIHAHVHTYSTQSTWAGDLRTHFPWYLWAVDVCECVGHRTWTWYQPLWALHESCVLHKTRERERDDTLGISSAPSLAHPPISFYSFCCCFCFHTHKHIYLFMALKKENQLTL